VSENIKKTRLCLDKVRLLSRSGSIFRAGEKNKIVWETNNKLRLKYLGNGTDLLNAVYICFAVNCRHLTPGPGSFEALTADNAGCVPNSIMNSTKTGIQTEDGKIKLERFFNV
jgi:hypothetical protein